MSDPLSRLTTSQLEVLRALQASGWLYKLAAVRMGVPEATLQTTVHRAVVRAGVSSRADLAYWLGKEDERAVRRGANVAVTGHPDGDPLGSPSRTNGRNV